MYFAEEKYVETYSYILSNYLPRISTLSCIGEIIELTHALMKISRWLSVSLIDCFCQDLNKIRAERDETILELNRTAHELAEIELQIEEANRFHWTMHIFIPGLIILFIQGPAHIIDILNAFGFLMSFANVFP